MYKRQELTMEQIKTKGLILKVLNLNDNDRIFTILTTELGKITVMAKGIRSQKNRMFSAMQLFCLSDFVFERRTGMYYPVDAQLCESFFDLRNSVEKVAFATYVADIVNAIPDEFPIEQPYFSFILNTLYLASKVDYSKPEGVFALLKLKVIFEFKTAEENGYGHSGQKCMGCGCEKDIKYFDFVSGGVICEKCIENAINTDTAKIGDKEHAALKFIQLADMRKVFSLEAYNSTIYNLSDISEKYLKYQTEIAPASLEYFKNLLNFEQ